MLRLVFVCYFSYFCVSFYNRGMKLSELKTGESGIIVKVNGYGGFRKRIIEMGFIKGKAIESLLNAPLMDPVKYKIMGYEVSLRRSEAEMIDIVTSSDVDDSATTDAPATFTEEETEDERLRRLARKKRREINIALVGNPNCGKTSLFNFASGAHERVGNYAGVTVDAKSGYADFEGYRLNLVDLPGTYSLSAYSPEELYVRKQLTEHTPDIVINVVDASNIERNLYLTTQLIDMNIPMVCALNMFDETEKRGDKFNLRTLSTLLGVPMIPTVFTSGRGVKLLFHIIINMYEGEFYVDKEGKISPEVAREIREWHDEWKDAEEYEGHEEDYAKGNSPHNNVARHIHINYGHEIENGIADIQKYLKQNPELRQHYSTRYLAIKLLEHDSEAEKIVATLTDANHIFAARNMAASRVLEETHADCETRIMDAKYGFIRGALKEAGYMRGDEDDVYKPTHLLDRVITNRYVGFPIFFLILFIVFETTFSLGQYPMDWIEAGVGWLGSMVSNIMPEGPLRDMIVDGAIAGVGSVIVFLPQILILYAFISFMEDSGYMSRAAFIMDKVMHGIGLHGKSFIPLIMGFGCNVPAVMATRTIESPRSRLLTMLILPLMSCSARLPIYIMIVATFFAPSSRAEVMISLYVVGIIFAALIGRLFSRWLIKGDDVPFVMELPPYRFPTWKAIGRHTWEKGREYLKKMGGIILVASIIVWALGYFPRPEKAATERHSIEQSYIGKIGKTIEPVFRPQGFDWKLDVALLSGVGAKEIVASTMGVLYAEDTSVADIDNTSSDKYTRLHDAMTADGITPLTAYCFLLFVVLYFPCIATIAAIKNETGTWRWAIFAALYTTLLAWIVSALVFQVGKLIN